MEDKQLNIHGNAAQMQAIRHRDGPAMVLAGPGSGKTFVIVQRIRTLIEQYRIPPSEILTITFTRQAAIEMRQRFLKITEHRFPEAVFGTFHSVFYQILTRSHPDKKLTLIDEREKQRIAEMILKDIAAKEHSPCLSDDLVSQYLFGLSRAKATGTDPEEIAQIFPEPDLFPLFFREYRRMLSELNRLDFDDIITDCGRLFAEEPDTLKTWRERFRYFLIDEYQDINAGQFEVMKQLAAPADNLFVVGDDDQSIYGFRGSSPAYMLDFDQHYPDAERILLSVNYRCRQSVIDAAMRVIGENRQRFVKEIRAGRPEPGEVRIMSCTDRNEEHAEILKYLKNRDPEETAAVIVRTNAHVS
ncbi:MAG: ATP-dependent helicase, partial [Lachnospiraceae bacterium]|nr:ATP-dependent helicase [Lachnospiraceae bacterium]